MAARAEKLYFEQFKEYIENHLPRLVAAKTFVNAAEAGLPRILMEYRPEHIWIVKDVTLHRSGFLHQGWKERPFEDLAASIRLSHAGCKIWHGEAKRKVQVS